MFKGPGSLNAMLPVVLCEIQAAELAVSSRQRREGYFEAKCR